MSNRSFGKRTYVSRLKFKSGWPELTALIDIMFLSLIFFSLSSSFVRISGISVELPQTETANMANLEKFIVTLSAPDGDQEGQLFFNDQQLSIDMLKQKFNEISNRSLSSSIIIRADKKVDSQRVAEVMALVQAANLSSFIAVSPPKSSKAADFITEEI